MCDPPCQAGLETCFEGACVVIADASDMDGDGHEAAQDCDDNDVSIHPEVYEQCDGIDNNCDGQTDEDCPPCEEGQGRLCGTSVGMCAPGFQICFDGKWGSCEERVRPSPEECDWLDNDCDGLTDEVCPCTDGDIFPCGVSGDGCWLGEQLCRDGSWNDCTARLPEPELCDGFDNDCDGYTDEGYELPGDPKNCGECGNDCSDNHPDAPSGSTMPTCQNSWCRYYCLGDYYDVNGDRTDGCECLDTEVYPQSNPNSLGVVTDCDDVFFTVQGKLPLDATHYLTEDWYRFTFQDDVACDTEFYLLFKSAPDTTSRASLFEEGVTTPLEVVESSNDVVKISRDTLTDGRDYLVKLELYVPYPSCDSYTMVIGDGCCSDACNAISCTSGCGVDCPQLD